MGKSSPCRASGNSPGSGPHLCPHWDRAVSLCPLQPCTSVSVGGPVFGSLPPCVKCGTVGRGRPPGIWRAHVVDTVRGSPCLRACLSVTAHGLLLQLGERLATVRATLPDQGGRWSEERGRPVHRDQASSVTELTSTPRKLLTSEMTEFLYSQSLLLSALSLSLSSWGWGAVPGALASMKRVTKAHRRCCHLSTPGRASAEFHVRKRDRERKTRE